MCKKMRIFFLLLLAVFLMVGCGTPMYELTDEEQDLIVQYSAYALARRNIFQKDGMTTAMPEPEPPVSSQEETETEIETEGGTQTPQRGESSDPDSKESGEALSLAAAIGHETDLSVSYDGYKVMKTYQVENYFSVDADQGKTLIVMNFTIKNIGSKTVELKLLDQNIAFYASFDGTERIAENVAFGLNSLSTYEGKIKAGKSQKTLLIFQVPEDQADKYTEESLFVKLKDTTYSVKL